MNIWAQNHPKYHVLNCVLYFEQWHCKCDVCVKSHLDHYQELFAIEMKWFYNNDDSCVGLWLVRSTKFCNCTGIFICIWLCNGVSFSTRLILIPSLTWAD